MTIKPDGVLLLGAPGPSDQTSTTKGSWKITGNLLVLSGAGRYEEFEIELLDDELLRLRQRSHKEVTDGDDQRR